jgi:DNA polymerase I-like protein with 3'-5' exonuclease and polymerase domains
MVLARRLLHARGLHTVRFVNTVHDSIITEIPNPAWVPQVVESIDEAAAQAYQWIKSWMVVPVIMEHAVGESWGSLEKVSSGNGH